MRLNEEDLRSRFSKHQKQPPEGVWEGVQKELKQKKRRRGFLIFLLSAGFITLLGGAGFWLFNEPGLQGQSPQISGNVPGNNAPLSKPSGKSGIRDSINYKDSQAVASSGNHTQKVQDTIIQKQSRMAARQQTDDRTSDRDKAMYASIGDKVDKVGKNSKNSHLKAISSLGLQKRSTKPAAWNLPALPKVPDAPKISMPDSFVSSGKEKTPPYGNQKWSFGIHVKPFLSQYEYESRNLQNRELLDKTATAERTGKGLAAGLNVSYRLNDKLRLRTGLGYSFSRQPFKRSFKRIDEIEVTDPDTFTNDSLDPQNDPPEQKDTIFHKHTVKHQNRYHRLAMPLLLSYKVTSFGQWEISGTTGIQASYLFAVDARLLQRGKKHFKIAHVKLTDNPLIRTFNLQYHLQVGIRYNLGKQWSLTASPAFSTRLFSSYTDQHPVKRKASDYGLSIGLQKGF